MRRPARLALILLAIAAWIASVPLVFQASQDWYADYSGLRFSHDGQAGMAVFFFGLEACLGYGLLSAVAVWLFRWSRRRRRD